jgi:hypothetical protein
MRAVYALVLTAANKSGRPTIRDVIRAVSDHYGLQPRDIMRRDRHAKVA